MRRYGQPAEPGRSYTRRPGAYAVLLRGEDVLLTHQMGPTAEFQLPGGGLDPGEGPLAALHREVFEETGWRIGTPRRLMDYRRFTFMPDYDIWAEKICMIFVSRPVRAHGAPQEPGHSAVWMPLALAADLVASPGDQAALRMLQQQR